MSRTPVPTYNSRMRSALRFALGVWLGACLACAFGAAIFAESAAGLRWTAPAGWASQPPQAMRAATYRVGPVAGDNDPAECGVYFFGPGQGGSVAANIDRWKGQFRGANTAPAPAQVSKRTISGLAVTVLDTSGSYSGLGGPMSSGDHVVANYRLLGAIVEGPGGNIFIKFTGPARTIASNQQKFEQLLSSFQREK